MMTLKKDPGSFRDRNGRIFYSDGDVFRALSKKGHEQWLFLKSSACINAFLDAGSIVKTEEVNLRTNLLPNEWEAVLKHERVPFISYPYEWSFDMMKDAALFQLELLQAALDEGLILKDATPYNIQWKGTRPVFIDVLSFEKYLRGEPWVAYQQFCRLFLYPLMLQAYKNIPYQPWLRGSIEGISPSEANHIMSFWDIFRRGVMMHVFLQAKFQQVFSTSNHGLKKDLEEGGFKKELVLRNVRNLCQLVNRLSPPKDKKSSWSDYAQRSHYTGDDLEVKRKFVREATHSGRWNLVWDLGCNDGMFSLIASENAEYVISMDADPTVINQFYQKIKLEHSKHILPLLINLADIPLGLGWRGLERNSLMERGKPDLILCLALIHHMAIGSNIPVREFIEYLASLGGNLVIEFVTKDDPMVKILLRNKMDQYHDYTLEYFELCLNEFFNITKQIILNSGTRKLYYACLKNTSSVQSSF